MVAKILPPKAGRVAYKIGRPPSSLNSKTVASAVKPVLILAETLGAKSRPKELIQLRKFLVYLLFKEVSDYSKSNCEYHNDLTLHLLRR